MVPSDRSEVSIVTDKGSATKPVCSGKSKSAAQASGLWFCTIMSGGFVLTQADSLFGTPILPALLFWVPIGVLLDIWARRQKAIEPYTVARSYMRRVQWWLLLVLVVVIALWTAFRPGAQAVSTGPWITTVDSFLDRIQVVLPGLSDSRSTLRAAGRPDLAAYFGAYLVCGAGLWIIGMATLARFMGITPAKDLAQEMTETLPNAYPAKPTIGTYVWRFVYACHYWLVFSVVVLLPVAVWHQEVIGTDRVTSRVSHNVVSGFASFAPGAAVFLIGTPLGAWVALRVRTALRVLRIHPRDESHNS